MDARSNVTRQNADTNGNRQGAPSPGERVWVLQAGAGCRESVLGGEAGTPCIPRLRETEEGSRGDEEVAGGGREKRDYKLTFDERGVRD